MDDWALGRASGEAAASEDPGMQHLAATDVPLRLNEHWLRAIYHHAPVMVLLGDSTAQLIHANPRAQKAFGYSLSELRRLSLIEATHPDDRAETTRRLGALLRGESDHYHIEKRLVRKDGGVFWGDVSVSLLFGRDRAVEAIVTVIVDITERKMAEDALQEAQERLVDWQRRETQRAEEELSRLREQLVRQTQLATIGQLSASIAHELRNPLGIVRNAAYMLARKLPGDGPWSEYVQMIEREVTAADRIIREVTAMTRGHAPQPKPADLERIVAAARQRVRAPETVAWQISCEPRPFMIEVDAEQFEQVFRNLLANAVQAMGSQGEVRVVARRRPEAEEIEISDSGPGIPPERRELVFEPLVSSRPRGMGLGLTICRQIVQRHGGTIEVADSAAGAMFRIRLPRVVALGGVDA